MKIFMDLLANFDGDKGWLVKEVVLYHVKTKEKVVEIAKKTT